MIISFGQKAAFFLNFVHEFVLKRQYVLCAMCLKKYSRLLDPLLINKGGTIWSFFKEFQLRYSGPVKKLRNGLNKKILQKKIQIFFGLTGNLQKTECTRLRDFLFCNFFVYEPILSFLVLKMFKI